MKSTALHRHDLLELLIDPPVPSPTGYFSTPVSTIP